MADIKSEMNLNEELIKGDKKCTELLCQLFLSHWWKLVIVLGLILFFKGISVIVAALHAQLTIHTKDLLNKVTASSIASSCSWIS